MFNKKGNIALATVFFALVSATVAVAITYSSMAISEIDTIEDDVVLYAQMETMCNMSADYALLYTSQFTVSGLSYNSTASSYTMLTDELNSKTIYSDGEIYCDSLDAVIELMVPDGMVYTYLGNYNPYTIITSMFDSQVSSLGVKRTTSIYRLSDLVLNWDDDRNVTTSMDEFALSNGTVSSVNGTDYIYLEPIEIYVSVTIKTVTAEMYCTVSDLYMEFQNGSGVDASLKYDDAIFDLTQYRIY